MGNVCVQLGQPAEALASLRQALQLRPDYAEAHFHLGNLLKQQGSLDEAVAHLQQAIRLAPGQASAHGSLGVAYFERGDLTESLACWQQASSLQPASLTFKGLVVNNLQSLCLWESLEAQTQSLIDSVDAGTGADNVTPFIFLTLPIPTTAAQQHRAASAFMKERCARRRFMSMGTLTQTLLLPGHAASRLATFPPIFTRTRPRCSLPGYLSSTTAAVLRCTDFPMAPMTAARCGGG